MASSIATWAGRLPVMAGVSSCLRRRSAHACRLSWRETSARRWHPVLASEGRQVEIVEIVFKLLMELVRLTFMRKGL